MAHTTTSLKIGKYQLQQLLGQGSFGTVYLCRHDDSGALACVKLENLEINDQQIAFEYRLYRRLEKSPAASFVPKALSFGESGEYRYMLLELGGKDLSHVVDSYEPREKLKIFHNLVTGLEHFHNAGILHRDIKPKNILIRRGSISKIMIIDVGLAKRYRLDGRHHCNQWKKTAVGTSRYSSAYSQMFTETSRRDDLISACYSMVVVFGRTLPWQNLKGTKKQKQAKTLELKRISTPAEVCIGCPASTREIYRHVVQLGFAEKPNYELYRRLIRVDLEKQKTV